MVALVAKCAKYFDFFVSVGEDLAADLGERNRRERKHNADT